MTWKPRKRRDKRKRKTCPTGKFRYPNEASARAEILFAEVAYHTGRVPKRAYLCPECQGWHLTSKG